MGCRKLSYYRGQEALEKPLLKKLSCLGEKNDSPDFCVDYSPFGLTFNSFKREGELENNFLFSGKERQDELGIDWYDYGARMFAPDIARWNGVDASAENYVNQSPYHYAGNNPVKFVDFDGNDYGVKVDRGNKTITIKAHFLTSSKTASAFKTRGSGKWNAQSGKNVFVAGGIKALRKGSADVYKVNINVTSEVVDGENVINGRVLESSTPRDDKANADQTGTVNSFDTVKEFPQNDNQNGGTSNNEVDVKASKLNSGTTTHETSHAMGNAHTDQGGTLNPTGGEGVGRSNISETLAGVGIGGNTAQRNAGSTTGDGTLLNGSTNSGLGTGKVISQKRYNRIVKRIERRQDDF